MQWKVPVLHNLAIMIVTARVPGPAQVGFRAGPGNGHFSSATFWMQRKADMICCIYSSCGSCGKKAA